MHYILFCDILEYLIELNPFFQLFSLMNPFAILVARRMDIFNFTITN